MRMCLKPIRTGQIYCACVRKKIPSSGRSNKMAVIVRACAVVFRMRSGDIGTERADQIGSKILNNNLALSSMYFLECQVLSWENENHCSLHPKPSPSSTDTSCIDPTSNYFSTVIHEYTMYPYNYFSKI